MNSTDDSVSSWIWEQGDFVSATSVPLTDRGFRYGMSVFESLRVTRGRPEFFEKHRARLLQACAERELSVNETALAAARDLFEPEQRSGFARLYVTAGDGSPSTPAEAPRIFVLLEDRPLPNPDDPWEITQHDDTYHPAFGGLKTGNYWFNTDAFARARRRGFDETLLYNDRAELVCAAFANVFVLRDGQLCTPPRSAGARAGVIREWVLNRRRVEERRLRREDVINADEIFLTNSWIGIQPVATLEGRPLGPRKVAPKLAAELQADRESPAERD